MLDKQGRLLLGKDLLAKGNLEPEIMVQCFFDRKKKALLLIPEETIADGEDFYFIQTLKIHKCSRIFMPDKVKKIFPEAKYMPTIHKDKIYILIFDN